MSAPRPVAKKPVARKPKVVAVPDPEPESTSTTESEVDPSKGSRSEDVPPAAVESPAASEPPAKQAAAEEQAGATEANARPNAWAAPMNALGGFIRAQRQLAKLSLRDMATMTSVSNAYLSQVERGLHQPSLKVLHSIADALQLSTEQLLSQAGWATQSSEQAGSTGGTEEAIRTDPRLTPEQRTALLGVYRSFVDGTA